MPHFSAVEPPNPVIGHYFVYILLCADGSYYVGQSNNVRERLRKHRYCLGSKHTADNRLVKLIYVDGPYSLPVAVGREAQLKRWSRAKKEALVRGDFSRLRLLAASREARSESAERRPCGAAPTQSGARLDRITGLYRILDI